MTTKKVLITGGAGFIGRAVARLLLAEGHEITILDNFSEQVHDIAELPLDLGNSVTLVRADVRDAEAVREATRGQQCIIHLAAETGTGQSMYSINHYFDVNVQATATLLEILQNDEDSTLETIMVASSRAIYGEGAYRCRIHGTVYPAARSAYQMSEGQFEPTCPDCQGAVILIPTNEAAPFSPSSFYGLTKQTQEQAVLLFARTRNIKGFALRYQNVYGPGQSLQNPYTGILAVFSNLARAGNDIEIYEDGRESRDFVYIDDVAAVTARCVAYDGEFIGALNVGSGVGTDVMTVAARVSAHFKSRGKTLVTGAYRVGDIRHNVADISRLQQIFGVCPITPFEDGLHSFLAWAEDQEAHDKNAYGRSVDELRRHKLLVDTRTNGN